MAGMLVVTGAPAHGATWQRGAATEPTRTEPPSAENDPARVIVGLKTSFTPEGRMSAAQRSQQRIGIDRDQEALKAQLAETGFRTIREYRTIPFIALELDRDGVEAVNASKHVASVQNDHLATPSIQTTAVTVGADAMWQAGRTGTDQIIAVLDTGIETTHPFLAGRVKEEACFSNAAGSGDGTSTCPNGQVAQTGSGAGTNCSVTIEGCEHGTHVAGIAASNYLSAKGVAKSSDVMSVQVYTSFTGATCTDRGAPSPCIQSYTSDLIAGLERVYALRETRSFAAVNMSLGSGLYGTNCDASEVGTKAAIDNLLSAGIPTVVASGNDFVTDAVSAPACITSAIAVGSTNDAGTQISAFSNNHPTLVDLMAPGETVASSIPGASFARFSGTSMAAPHVAGAFALLTEHSPQATVAQKLSALQTTGVAINDPAANPPYTRPRIRTFHATVPLGGCPDDSAEPDDTQASASALAMTGVPTIGLICADDVDFFKTSAESGSALKVSLTGTGQANGLDFAVEDANGSVLDAATGNSGFIQVVAPADGQYYVKVYGTGQAMGSYSVSLRIDASLNVAIKGKGLVSGSQGIYCPGTCATVIHVGYPIALLATRAKGWRFVRWTGACAGSTKRCEFTATGPITTTAVFKRIL